MGVGFGSVNDAKRSTYRLGAGKGVQDGEEKWRGTSSRV